MFKIQKSNIVHVSVANQYADGTERFFLSLVRVEPTGRFGFGRRYIHAVATTDGETQRTYHGRAGKAAAMQGHNAFLLAQDGKPEAWNQRPEAAALQIPTSL